LLWKQLQLKLADDFYPCSISKKQEDESDGFRVTSCLFAASAVNGFLVWKLDGDVISI